jgi:hypothetical protein
MSKDKWVSDGAAVLTYPPIPDQFAENSAVLLFERRAMLLRANHTAHASNGEGADPVEL